ncbi:MAG TPA: hypothetical protein VJN95_12880 [Gemmatimonadales bacterium]|nr:hypothetical protein [Gemmatimonadales bacterium]
MPLLIGVLLAVAVGVMCTAAGLDRDRALYPAVTLVVASYYILFGVMGGSTQALVLEILVATIYIVAAVVGFRSSLWIVVIALAGHGALDLVHDRVITNPGMPAWWPAFCLAYDVTAAAYLAWVLKTSRVPVRMR